MRVLVVRVGAMGDVLHALPAVAALRRARPDWTVDWVVDPRWAALLRDTGDADGTGYTGDAATVTQPGPVVSGVVLARTQLWKAAPWSRETLHSLIGLRRQLREQPYDAVIDMQGTLRSAVIARMAGRRPKARLAGVMQVAGYSDPREPAAAWLYTHRCVRRGTHVVQQGAALLGEALGLDLAVSSPDLASTPLAVPLPRISWAEAWAETTAVQRRPLCVLGAGGGWAAKQWPAERYGALAAVLQARGYDVVVNAPHQDNAVALGVVAASAGAARMVVCNVAGLVALLRRTDLFIGGDTGPTHLAAALAVPTVALFGPTCPARNGPWGPGRSLVLRDAAAVTSYKRSQIPDAGLSRLTVEQVATAASL